MRITKKTRVAEWISSNPDARAALTRWLEVASAASWQSINDVRKDFPHADAVTVASGRVATVFNIAGNHYRLITAIHYNAARVFTMRFLTHAEYDKDRWKVEL